MSCWVPFDNRPGYNAYFEFASQFAVAIEVFLILRCLSYVDRIFGNVAVQMVPVVTSEDVYKLNRWIAYSGNTTSCAC